METDIPFSLDGMIIPIRKPPGISSFSVVKQIRKASGIKKVGHGGTLDPFAEGVLLIGIGRSATKQLGSFLHGDKEYIAEVVLGIVTDTYDPTGKVIERNSYEMPEDIVIEKTLEMFKGEVSQLPPVFSAIKVNGVRSYKAARKGIELELKTRKVNIREIELLRVNDVGFEIKVCCSHGTYIRSLAYDIGRALGCGAHLGKLIRTRVGEYDLEQSEALDDFIRRAAATARIN